MRKTRLFFSMATLTFLAIGNVMAQPAATENWQAGKNYFLIEPAQATHTGNKIEVTEVFSWGCPACNASYPFIDKIRKALPSNAEMDYVPASFHPEEGWVLFQRTYYAAKALGVEAKAHDAMFDAIWKTGELATYANGRPKRDLPTINDVAKFFAKYGVKPETFVATANSFAVNTKMRQADAYVKATGVDQTPTIIVNGKYRLTTVSAGGGWDKAQALVLYLVKKESAGG